MLCSSIALEGGCDTGICDGSLIFSDSGNDIDVAVIDAVGLVIDCSLVGLGWMLILAWIA